MKIYPIEFNRFPYYEHLQISHFFYTIHIKKNVIETLWRILDGRTNKEKIGKICSDIQEANHAMKNMINVEYIIVIDFKSKYSNINIQRKDDFKKYKVEVD
jgi:hypothetical protein